MTFSNANDLLTVARLTGELDRPERAWLSVPGQRAASNAAQALYDAHRALAEAEAAARTYFTPDALRQDVAGLATRFANEYQGLGKLSGAYRADKRIVAAFTREGTAEETAQGHLGLAAAWKHAAEALVAAALLGPHYAGRATDFTRLDRALTYAATAVRCARGQDLSRAADYISRDAAPNGAVSGTVTEARQHLSAWQTALAPPPAIAPRPELQNGTIREAIGWLRAHLGALHAASEFTRAIDEVAGRPLTFGQARQLIGLREAAESAHAQLAARDAIFRTCGAHAGTATDVTRRFPGRPGMGAPPAIMITGGPGRSPRHTSTRSEAPYQPTAWPKPPTRGGSLRPCWRLSAPAPPELAAGLDDYSGGYRLLEAMFNDPRDVRYGMPTGPPGLPGRHGMGAPLT